ncbi:unnamed protein product [Arctia plantaginis]|uniref:Uncharacterized protein n=1 Tax=Arctia plantaginis TaxID=874455 RepID=A0A8S0YV93_ARCPL|nr:unnamed protein product [Arctia plantaginis]
MVLRPTDSYRLNLTRPLLCIGDPVAFTAFPAPTGAPSSRSLSRGAHEKIFEAVSATAIYEVFPPRSGPRHVIQCTRREPFSQEPGEGCGRGRAPRPPAYPGRRSTCLCAARALAQPGPFRLAARRGRRHAGGFRALLPAPWGRSRVARAPRRRRGELGRALRPGAPPPLALGPAWPERDPGPTSTRSVPLRRGGARGGGGGVTRARAGPLV